MQGTVIPGKAPVKNMYNTNVIRSRSRIWGPTRIHIITRMAFVCVARENRRLKKGSDVQYKDSPWKLRTLYLSHLPTYHSPDSVILLSDPQCHTTHQPPQQLNTKCCEWQLNFFTSTIAANGNQFVFLFRFTYYEYVIYVLIRLQHIVYIGNCGLRAGEIYIGKHII